ncbi:hypothetical protein CI238_02847 [Colletotrichum incanum]|uniref:Uncharacterized protein n=1 Tax=Colletotrichum incanum TaxID=1573173 RepID=A0A167CHQ2_COLIC|nr:hypothetical protein CI238_02847 [Colletotrichum incanum]
MPETNGTPAPQLVTCPAAKHTAIQQSRRPPNYARRSLHGGSPVSLTLHSLSDFRYPLFRSGLFAAVYLVR